MFSFCIKKNHYAYQWDISPHRIQSSRGWINILNHTVVKYNAVMLNGKLGVSIIEQSLDQDSHFYQKNKQSHEEIQAVNLSEWEHIRKNTLDWSLHWFWIEIDKKDITIISSIQPTVPVFLTSDNEYLRADWDPIRLYPYLSPQLNWEAAAHYLSTFNQPLSYNTVIDNLYQLVAGYKAMWQQDGDRWQFGRPSPYPKSLPRLLSPKADPLQTFESILTSVTRRLVGSQNHIGTGLSGGLDSTLVTGTLATLSDEINSYGVIVPGNDGKKQQQRRLSTVMHFNVTDYNIKVSPGYSPWKRLLEEDFKGFVPWEELYFKPFEVLYERAAMCGNQMFFTGLGGDDLLAPYWDELPDSGRSDRYELLGEAELPNFFTSRVTYNRVERSRLINDLPRAFVQRSALDSAAGMAAQSLRNGLWPAHPMISLELVEYCHSLPYEYRKNRKLMRDVLSRWRLPQSLSHPKSTESFEKTCQLAMRTCKVFSKLLDATRLADFGFIEPPLVRKSFNRWRSNNLSSSQGLHFVAITHLEATLKSIEESKISADLQNNLMVDSNHESHKQLVAKYSC